jgi:hypothetical protein
MAIFKMNNLVDQLKKADTLSIESLKRLYRSLVLKLHPDVTRKSGEEFVRLQEEYESALKYLLTIKESRGREPSQTQRAGTDSRSDFLRAFYIFSIKYYGKHWPVLVLELERLAEAYRPRVGRLISDYCETFLRAGREAWPHGPAAEANDILMTTVKRLACYYEDGLAHSKRLIESYLNELDQRSKRFDLQRARSLAGMTALMREELQGTKISLMTL